MPDATLRYSLTDLAGVAGVTPRTVRFYLSQGLLPSPGATGPGVKYGEEHLDRLRLIRRLQREHLPLADIRHRLAGLDGGQVAALAAQVLDASEPTPPPAAPGDTAIAYVRRLLQPDRPVARAMSASIVGSAPFAPSIQARIPPPVETRPQPPPAARRSQIERSQWERHSLGPDVELHVRRPLSRPMSKKVDRLISIARELLEEDPS
jgi:DNA-binding transcriptional MerR regulator